MQYLQILRGHLTDAVSFILHLDNMHFFLLSYIASSFQQNVWRYLHCSKAVTGKVLCSDSDTEPSCSFSMLKYVVFVLKCFSRGHMYISTVHLIFLSSSFRSCTWSLSWSRSFLLSDLRPWHSSTSPDPAWARGNLCICLLFLLQINIHMIDKTDNIYVHERS